MKVFISFWVNFATTTKGRASIYQGVVLERLLRSSFHKFYIKSDPFFKNLNTRFAKIRVDFQNRGKEYIFLKSINRKKQKGIVFVFQGKLGV